MQINFVICNECCWEFSTLYYAVVCTLLVVMLTQQSADCHRCLSLSAAVTVMLYSTVCYPLPCPVIMGVCVRLHCRLPCNTCLFRLASRKEPLVARSYLVSDRDENPSHVEFDAVFLCEKFPTNGRIGVPSFLSDTTSHPRRFQQRRY